MSSGFDHLGEQAKELFKRGQECKAYFFGERDGHHPLLEDAKSPDSIHFATLHDQENLVRRFRVAEEYRAEILGRVDFPETDSLVFMTDLQTSVQSGLGLSEVDGEFYLTFSQQNSSRIPRMLTLKLGDALEAYASAREETAHIADARTHMPGYDLILGLSPLLKRLSEAMVKPEELVDKHKAIINGFEE